MQSFPLFCTAGSYPVSYARVGNPDREDCAGAWRVHEHPGTCVHRWQVAGGGHEKAGTERGRKEESGARRTALDASSAFSSSDRINIHVLLLLLLFFKKKKNSLYIYVRAFLLREKQEYGVHCVSGTPGRVFDMIKRRSLRTRSIKVLVLDEADEMLNQGFKEQIYDIYRYLPPSTQVHIHSVAVPSCRGWGRG